MKTDPLLAGMKLLREFGADHSILDGTKVRSSTSNQFGKPLWKVTLDYCPEANMHTLTYEDLK